MSATVSGMRAGQPSTTQPIAGPWLSPKVVTRKRWPKVLNDMGSCPVRCGSPRTARGQMAELGWSPRERMGQQRTVNGHQAQILDQALRQQKSIKGVACRRLGLRHG